MKRLFSLSLLILFTLSTAEAQEVDTTSSKGNTVYINTSGDNVKMNEDGGLSLMLNGMRINFGGNRTNSSDSTGYYITLSDGTKLELSEQQIAELSSEMKERLAEAHSSHNAKTSHNRVQLGFLGVESPEYNHLAAMEVGTNIFTHTDYSAYSPEEAAQLAFTRSKSTYIAFNMITMNAALNPSRSLAVSMALGLSCENFTFAGDYTMEPRDGMMHAVALDPNTKKSKLLSSYIHIPVTFDWNIDRDWFISAGVSLDILMGSSLVYKKPRTTIEGTVTLNPIQVGLTARVGWRRLYGFINYSPMEMFKAGTGPKIHRMSVGAGIWF